MSLIAGLSHLAASGRGKRRYALGDLTSAFSRDDPGRERNRVRQLPMRGQIQRGADVPPLRYFANILVKLQPVRLPAQIKC